MVMIGKAGNTIMFKPLVMMVMQVSLVMMVMLVS